MSIHALFGLSLLTAFTVASVHAAEPIQVPERIASANKLVFCTEIAFPPWESIDPQTQQPVGFDIDIAAAVAERLGVVSEHKNISFDGLIPALQARQCDAVISELFDKPERREVVGFANYAQTGTAIMLRYDSTIAAQTVDELSGLKVAVGVGTTAEGVLADANERLAAAGKAPINVTVLQASTEAFQQLMAGLVDAYITTSDQSVYYNAQKPNSVKLTGDTLDDFAIGIAVLKDDTELLASIEAALANMREDGTYNAILDKWSFQDLAYP